MFKHRLHRKPFITAGVFLLSGIVLTALGFIRGAEGDMNNYALAAFGILFLIVSAVTFVMYGALEKKYQSLLRGEPLLRYTLKAEHHQAQMKKNIAELKAKNKALITVMLFFCVLFAIVLPFFVEEELLMIGICLGIGAFLFITERLITATRVWKLQRGGEEVVLGRGGAYLEGSFHAWDLPGSGISDLSYMPPAREGGTGELTITYSAAAGPAPQTETLTLLIPELTDEIPRVLQALEEARG
jgi:hypothetical protein